METQHVAQKPQSVSTAVVLLWASLAVGLVKVVIDYSYLMSQTPSVATVIFFLVLTFALLGFLVFRISAGKNWARIAFLVMFLIGVLPTVHHTAAEFSRSFFVGALSAAQLGLQGYALFLLFTQSGNPWFRKPDERLS